MGGQAIPVRVGGVDLWVEASLVTPVGSQPTSRADEAADAVLEAFDRAEAAVVAVAGSVASAIGRLGEGAERPERMEVEFGLKFSVQGSVVVASASGEATLRVLVSYAGRSRAAG